MPTLQLRLDPETAATPALLTRAAARQLGVAPDRIKRVDILRRSIDARQRRVMINLSVNVHIDSVDPAPRYTPPVYPDVSRAPQAVIVGAGPAGLFAALELIELGIRPIVLERGKDVDSRRRDLAQISRTHRVDPDSNYSFGEGGAGTFSDGKLYTRSTKRGPVEKVLQIFHTHGADDSVLIDTHPHIGTDRLGGIIKSIRETIRSHGGEVRFNTRVESLIRNAESGAVTGVVTASGERIEGPVILATGHSARDTYRMLADAGIPLEPKGIAVGVRLEHPQRLIDSIQYHSPSGRGAFLPPAEYSMLTRVDGRGVYSFCMCPGGVIVPAASGPGQLVVNGMSSSSRGSRLANSGMVVEVLPEDLPQYDHYGPLKMMHYQADIEEAFFHAAGNSLRAPAQRMTDFVDGRPSVTLPAVSYAPGVTPGRVDSVLPEPVSRRLRQGFADFGRKARGFLTHEAVVIGPETRTSAPVRIPRDPASRCHVCIPGLYPSGEGAGYAGGIVSAALDGINSARALAELLRP